MKDKLERIIEFTPAFGKRNSDPNKNYGVGGVDLKMVLKGPEGAVQFILYTHWMLPHIQKGIDLRILEKASYGSSFETYISEKMSGMEEVDTGMEAAKRYAGMSSSPKLDLLDLECSYHPIPADLGYHSPKPVYEGQTPISDSCEYLNDKPCYYDGSGLNAKKVFNTLLEFGSEGVWSYLEDYYKETFLDEREMEESKT